MRARAPGIIWTTAGGMTSPHFYARVARRNVTSDDIARPPRGYSVVAWAGSTVAVSTAGCLANHPQSGCMHPLWQAPWVSVGIQVGWCVWCCSYCSSAWAICMWDATLYARWGNRVPLDGGHYFLRCLAVADYSVTAAVGQWSRRRDSPPVSSQGTSPCPAGQAGGRAGGRPTSPAITDN